MASDVTFDLARMTPEARGIYLEVYAQGYQDGIEAGRRQLEAEHRTTWQAAAAVARAVAASETFDELAERRGQPARAERQRHILRARGVVA